MTIIWADSKGRDTSKEPVTEDTFRDLASKIDKSLDERFENNKTFQGKLGDLIGVYGVDDLLRILFHASMIGAAISIIRTFGMQ